MKILVVDDSPFMRHMLKRILGAGDEFREASNGEEAIEAYRSFKPALVFLDVIMPGKSGIVTLRELRSLDPDATVVICTSFDSREQITQACIDAGAADFVTKPFLPEDIAALMARLRRTRG